MMSYAIVLLVLELFWLVAFRTAINIKNRPAIRWAERLKKIIRRNPADPFDDERERPTIDSPYPPDY